MKDFEKNYNEMWEKFQTGEITMERWNELCRIWLENLLQEAEIRKVLKRLKED